MMKGVATSARAIAHKGVFPRLEGSSALGWYGTQLESHRDGRARERLGGPNSCLFEMHPSSPEPQAMLVRAIVLGGRWVV